MMPVSKEPMGWWEKAGINFSGYRSKEEVSAEVMDMGRGGTEAK